VKIGDAALIRTIERNGVLVYYSPELGRMGRRGGVWLRGGVWTPRGLGGPLVGRAFDCATFCSSDGARGCKRGGQGKDAVDEKDVRETGAGGGGGGGTGTWKRLGMICLSQTGHQAASYSMARGSGERGVSQGTF
jgi:hypothetical protein